MRQVIVIATDAAINVFTDEHGVTTQIATIVNTGTLEVPDLVHLGGGLVDALHLNGAEPSPPPSPPRALPPATMPKHRLRRNSRAPSIDDIIAFIREHDGCTTTEMARALVPVPLGSTTPVQTINNRLLGYRGRCAKQGVQPLIRSDGGGSGSPARHHWIGP